jgi:DIS3-like exonuclease 2
LFATSLLSFSLTHVWKDLDDALHIKELPDGRIEIGVHIADVSYFVTPGSPVDLEAQRRTTTVYLVDRTIPMLPRPLCEIACSLNENVERLAFSCVWTMNADGTLGRSPDIWYGRSVIRSCARLDYATAQNIIDQKVATGETPSEMDEALWPSSRRPDGLFHSVDQVAQDVRLMHRVAMARRRLRFDNGALALNGPKLTFKLDADGQTPLLAEPYPIRDSNRLVEEFMLMANYLVAQRLITHAKGRAVLRHHSEPLEDGLDKVAAVAKAAVGFDLDITSSEALHLSLQRLSRECQDDLTLQCVTMMLMTPMQPANYFVAGSVDSSLWKHFGLNIPYYTHFTSPIRRYPDVLVHRLLQATLDDDNIWDNFSLSEKDLQLLCEHSNEKRLAAKAAQERCDRVFLSLFVRANPLQGQLGVVLSVGNTAFTVYLPSLGAAALLYLKEHEDMLRYQSQEDADGQRIILLEEVSNDDKKMWHRLEIRVFTKLQVTVICQDRPPIDIKARFEGPWSE